MSYQGYQLAGDGGTASGGGGAGGVSAASESRLSNLLGSNIHKISQNVNSMQRMLTTTSDFTKLNEVQHYTNQLVKNTSESLKELARLPQPLSPSEQRQRRMLKERLTSEFSEVLKNFQAVQRNAAQKERESVQQARHSSSSLKPIPGYGQQSDTQDQDTLIDIDPFSRAAPQRGNQQLLEEEANIEELRERESAIRKIEGDIVEVNQIFKDLASMVHEQGEVIDSIEANVESASYQVHQGAEQIAKARDYQSKARRKTFLLLLFLAIILICVIIIVVVEKG